MKKKVVVKKASQKVASGVKKVAKKAAKKAVKKAVITPESSEIKTAGDGENNSVLDLPNDQVSEVTQDHHVDLPVVKNSVVRTRRPITISDVEMIRSLPVISDLDYLPQFKRDIKNPLSFVPTGFPQFDRIMGGGLRPGSVSIIGAMPSLGKTTYVIQLVDNIAVTGRDILIFSLEMSRKELVAKSYSRLTASFHEESYHKSGNFLFAKTADEIMNNRWRHVENKEYLDREMQYFADAERFFQESIAPHRFIVEPSGQCDFSYIASKTDEFCQVRSSQAKEEGKPYLAPIILIDFLQIISPAESKDTRQHLGETVRALKSLAVNRQTAILVISSLNRAGYKTPISYESFKESGDIEYCVDFLCGFNPICMNGNRFNRPGMENYDVNLAKSCNPRILELFVLKNRLGETSGEKGIFNQFFPSFNYFREINSDNFILESKKSTGSKSQESSPPTPQRQSNGRRIPTTNDNEVPPQSGRRVSSNQGDGQAVDEIDYGGDDDIPF